jgi:uncharacterized protein YutE (UPF0331/DUF86 family)
MVIIFCEGSDDKTFLRLLLNDLKKSGDIIGFENFDSIVKIMGGKSNLLNKDSYETINKQIGKQISKVLFIFDCDFEEDDKSCGGLEKSKKAIEDLIIELDWKIEVDYYIFNKNLDYFIIDTLDKKENFLGCEECFKLKELNKNRKILTCIYKSLYPKKPFDFSHENFDELKEKLKNLFKENQ